MPGECPSCGRTGYQGRVLLAELLVLLDPSWGPAILNRSDNHELQRIFHDTGGVSLKQHGEHLLRQGLTSPAEIRRVLGWRS